MAIFHKESGKFSVDGLGVCVGAEPQLLLLLQSALVTSSTVWVMSFTASASA